MHNSKKMLNFATQNRGDPAEHTPSPGGGMVDALVSGASAARRAGSSPVLGTLGGCLTTKVRQSLFYTQNLKIQAAFATTDISFGKKFK